MIGTKFDRDEKSMKYEKFKSMSHLIVESKTFGFRHKLLKF